MIRSTPEAACVGDGRAGHESGFCILLFLARLRHACRASSSATPRASPSHAFHAFTPFDTAPVEQMRGRACADNGGNQIDKGNEEQPRHSQPQQRIIQPVVAQPLAARRAIEMTHRHHFRQIAAQQHGVDTHEQDQRADGGEDQEQIGGQCEQIDQHHPGERGQSQPHRDRQRRTHRAFAGLRVMLLFNRGHHVIAEQAGDGHGNGAEGQHGTSAKDSSQTITSTSTAPSPNCAAQPCVSASTPFASPTHSARHSSSVISMDLAKTPMMRRSPNWAKLSERAVSNMRWFLRLPRPWCQSQLPLRAGPPAATGTRL
jgi:hypothetical protein